MLWDMGLAGRRGHSQALPRSWLGQEGHGQVVTSLSTHHPACSLSYSQGQTPEACPHVPSRSLGLGIAHPLNKNAEPGRATITSTASASGSGNCDHNPQGAQASASQDSGPGLCGLWAQPQTCPCLHPARDLVVMSEKAGWSLRSSPATGCPHQRIAVCLRHRVSDKPRPQLPCTPRDAPGEQPQPALFSLTLPGSC